MTPDILTTDAALAEWVDALRGCGRFAFDTEFVGEDRYKPEVCLLQVATEERSALIDPLSGLDTRPLWELIADPAVQVIVHAGSEDLALCKQQTGRTAANVIDLQIAAGLVGLGYPTSLSRLVRIATGAKLHKSQTLTDWRRRPLSPDQIDYAVEDVRHLPAIGRYLEGQLASLGRTDWCAQECAELCATAAAQTNNTVQIRRLRGAGSLSAKELTIAEALLNTRDDLAKELDRPARAVLRDHLLVELARRGWTDPHRIRSLRGLNLGMAGIKRLAKAVEEAKKLPPKGAPELTVEGDTNDEEAILAMLTAVLRDFCNHRQLSYSLLAGKEDLRQVVRRRTRPEEPAGQVRLQTGWRGHAVGRLVEEVLSGVRAVRVAAVDGKYRLEIE